MGLGLSCRRTKTRRNNLHDSEVRQLNSGFGNITNEQVSDTSRCDRASDARHNQRSAGADSTSRILESLCGAVAWLSHGRGLVGDATKSAP